MLHKRYRKLLSAYLDGELDEKRKGFVEEHLKECKACSEELKTLQSIDQMARVSIPPLPSEEYWKTLPGRIRSRIILEEEKSWMERLKGLLIVSPSRLKLVSTFAVVVLVLLVGRHFFLEEWSLTISRKGVKEEIKTEEPSGEGYAFREELKPSPTIPEEVTKITPPPAEIVEEKPSMPIASPSFTELKEKELGKKEAGERYREGLGVIDETSIQPSEEEPASRPMIKEAPSISTELTEGEKEKPFDEKVDRKMVFSEGQDRISRSNVSGYEIALSYQSRGEYGDAIKNFNQVIQENRDLAPSAQFQINLIQSSMKDTVSEEDRLKRNIETWRSFVNQYPESELLPEAYRNLADNAYLLSRVTNKDEDVQQAIETTQKYLEFEKGRRTAELYLRQKMELERELSKRRRG